MIKLDKIFVGLFGICMVLFSCIWICYSSPLLFINERFVSFIEQESIACFAMRSRYMLKVMLMISCVLFALHIALHIVNFMKDKTWVHKIQGSFVIRCFIFPFGGFKKYFSKYANFSDSVLVSFSMLAIGLVLLILYIPLLHVLEKIIEVGDISAIMISGYIDERLPFFICVVLWLVLNVISVFSSHEDHWLIK